MEYFAFMYLVSSVFVLYSGIFVVLAVRYIEEYKTSYVKQLKVKYLGVLLLAPHSTLIVITLYFLHMLANSVGKSNIYQYIVSFMNKRLF